MTVLGVPPPATAALRSGDVALGRRHRSRRRARRSVGLGALLVLLFAAALMIGNTFYGPWEVLRVVAGQEVQGASFTVGTLRLPRAVMAVLAGASLGAAGVTFQTLLRNPLASPDIIGISKGASAAAVFAIVSLSASETTTSALAVGAALATALAVYLLSVGGGAVGTRFVLVGIGLAAMLDSLVLYQLSRAAEWQLQTAMRWLTGSINGATWGQVVPLAVAVALLGPVLLSRSRGLALLQHGDDAARALGLRVPATRLVVIGAAVTLLAFATAAAGPVAFVAFLSGPIAARLVGPGGSLLVPAALVGALLVLGADLIGQWAFGTRYPVGVVTGVLGAPYLVALVIRSNRSGGSL